MFFKLFLLFVITPLVELAILIKLGEVLGFAPTFALVIITGALGAGLAHQQGLRVINEFKKTLERGAMPTDPIIDGLLVVVGGAFLLTPGLITDIVGFTLVIPMTRKFIRQKIKRNLKTRIHVSVNASGPTGFYYTNVGGEANPANHRKSDDSSGDVIDI